MYGITFSRESSTKTRKELTVDDSSAPGDQDRTGRASASVFSAGELSYLADKRLGRLATVDRHGMPHVVPLGWAYNPTLDTIDIGGRDFANTQKFRNAARNPNVALVIDDVLPPFRPRCIMVRGSAEAIEEAAIDGEPTGPIIRITATQVISWGLDGKVPEPDAADAPPDQPDAGT
jgi:pyridoxamine 5'-phosphate oxidase family protein